MMKHSVYQMDNGITGTILRNTGNAACCIYARLDFSAQFSIACHDVDYRNAIAICARKFSNGSLGNDRLFVGCVLLDFQGILSAGPIKNRLT